ncbi:MAG: tRNA (adenosine(37)-N6)-threonylcarbamoyltransferase complex transferase subunit TsaD [Candidatus Marsarchaeota archaeon]|nr:tRNA (adenosine(37)-N6)-threonylcarbamoyltransferase complex transferase subunit TsaD [Candidatus Marsarchaeota archaeon]MCL5102400.1 tRNA (adenosine(37)-N6)-threonylcarbamoyltransferase complex transferase subunit TsaD [Candidatus Marsarchaeota archaeon]
MAVLGIESSAHTFGVGISENGKILANSKRMYNITASGMIPSRVAEFHASNAKGVIEEAMASAGIGFSEISAISYTKGPGLGPCLRIGQLAALTLAERLNVPVYPVNHAVGHIKITEHLSGIKDPLAVYVSGGNSQILGAVDKPFRHYNVYGETLDIGVGNMLDNYARAAKLNPAWGSTVAKVAENGSYVGMPYTVKGMDFTFTGLLTNAIKMLESNPVKDVSYSIQETAFSMIAEAAERAMLLTRNNGIILCGGVAQSKRLQEILRAMSLSHGSKFFVAPNEYNADNGAMIAYVGELMHKGGKRVKESELTIMQRYRVDEVDLSWH